MKPFRRRRYLISHLQVRLLLILAGSAMVSMVSASGPPNSEHTTAFIRFSNSSATRNFR